MAKIRLRYVNSFNDRHGRRRHQCRIPGQKSFALPGLPGSAEFMDAYQAALANASIAPSEIGASRTKAGTLDAAIVGYYKSKNFIEDLAPSTQQVRRNILERFRAARAPSGQSYGEKRIALLQRHHIEKLFEPMSRDVQKGWLKALRGLMTFAVAEGMMKTDPTKDIKAAATKGPKSKGHMTWLEPQVERYRQHYALGTTARLALELMLNIAARRQDAHLLGDQHISDGRIVWRPKKTMRTTNKLLKVKILPEFQAALDAMSRPKSVLNFLTTNHGKPFASAAAFGNKFADWCRAAGLKPVLCDDGKVRSYRAHGLRKAALRAYAQAGCTDQELIELSGHADARQLRAYLNEVNQEQMADSGVAKLINKRQRDLAAGAAANDQNGNADLQTELPALTNRELSA
jgi:integrase/recombinase XerD